MTTETLIEPEDRVLSTLNADGSRRWLRPRVSPGRFWHARRGIAYLLIVIFAALPYININGKPAILLDIVNREFTFFGKTLFATDTLLLALFMMIVFVTIFMLTAILGRIWCGWVCPQTVYMEFLYRPIERLLEGKPGSRKLAKIPGWKRVLKFIIFLGLSVFIAHIFIAYFVGAHNLRHWILGSPMDHPIAFAVMVVVTTLMMFDFGFFREQLCIVACPYGRMQSVMLDRSSLIVAYDKNRGEPRGKLKPKKPASDNGDVELGVLNKTGDCIDCTMCVQTCPTGIDIRDGLQMECIHCTQCIDACDAIMDKIGKPRGLIRYSSQEALETGKSHFLRPRMVIYPVVLIALVSAFVLVLLSKSQADVELIRTRGTTFSTLPDGSIINNARIRITNRTDAPVVYHAVVLSPDGVSVEFDPEDKPVAPESTESINVHFMAPPELFITTPQPIEVQVIGSDEFEKKLKFSMHGPYWKGKRP